MEAVVYLHACSCVIYGGYKFGVFARIPILSRHSEGERFEFAIEVGERQQPGSAFTAQLAGRRDQSIKNFTASHSDSASSNRVGVAAVCAQCDDIHNSVAYYGLPCQVDMGDRAHPGCELRLLSTTSSSSSSLKVGERASCTYADVREYKQINIL